MELLTTVQPYWPFHSATFKCNVCLLDPDLFSRLQKALWLLFWHIVVADWAKLSQLESIQMFHVLQETGAPSVLNSNYMRAGLINLVTFAKLAPLDNLVTLCMVDKVVSSLTKV